MSYETRYRFNVSVNFNSRLAKLRLKIVKPGLREFCDEIETNGSLMVQDQDYKMDTSKLPNRVLSIFDGSSKMCEVWLYRNGK